MCVTCGFWVSGWEMRCVLDCVGCPSELDSSCSHWERLEVSPAQAFYKDCYACIFKTNSHMWFMTLLLKIAASVEVLSDSFIIQLILFTLKYIIRSYPRVPRPAKGGLGGFCVGGLVLDRVPPLTDWLLPCCWLDKQNISVSIRPELDHQVT